MAHGASWHTGGPTGGVQREMPQPQVFGCDMEPLEAPGNTFFMLVEGKVQL